MAVGLGTGTTITFATSGFAMQLVGISDFSISREVKDKTHMGTTTGGPRNKEPGKFIEVTLNADFHFDPALSIPITAAEEVVTVDFAGSGNTWTGNAFMSQISAGAQIEEMMTLSTTLVFTSLSGF